MWTGCLTLLFISPLIGCLVSVLLKYKQKTLQLENDKQSKSKIGCGGHFDLANNCGALSMKINKLTQDKN